MVHLLVLAVAFVLGAAGARDPGHQAHDLSSHPSPVANLGKNLPTQVSPRLARATSDTGALLCGTNEVCLDGSCCGPLGICGYGPDFCGAGCLNNCDAKAMCGIYSEGGTEKCGMNLCCGAAGWCGTSETHCIGPDYWPCQEGYGSCQIVQPPSCDANAGSAEGRRIGYYQSWNVRDRVCMKVAPSDIQTANYTHLYFSFASIDPDTFAVVPANAGDVALMYEFTALKSSTLQTWIAIGGYSFSDPGPTHTTWSDMVSTQARRAAFIQSLIVFMQAYGFQGADLDWEYPVDEKRGGRKGDSANFALLVKEMRQAFGAQYGISLALAPDYWYLRYFDAKAMEPYVDWFGFMAYDLHGSWDSDVGALGSIVRGQADVREIYNNTMPLWYAALNPAKINFGLAYYGRGYTLANPACNTLGCGFTGPNKPFPCTAYPGVMSLAEGEKFARDNGITPKLLAGAMMKELTWDDQWVGYDDHETIEMKMRFASGLCFGGTMAWSIDFNSGAGSGLEPPVTTDGTCGAVNGNTVCGNGFGNCCSASGWCGDSAAHCGSGCQSGECLTGFVTTDGTCGAAHGDSICGNWAAGGCCSSSGFCGSSDAHCGTGCQSGCDGKGGNNTSQTNFTTRRWMTPSPRLWT
ncbi:glycoside hydrolase superfamily [Chaetomium fimeti]|uniref:chitinase n=1 Tax=Chaetomium fimeti TaxID=1854472 RepID=A0AAE0H5F3_9PEZI|nr:glycoside hydrolase superfamily [Chaetomium fimeti]